MTATCNNQHQLKSTLAKPEPSTHDSTDVDPSLGRLYGVRKRKSSKAPALSQNSRLSSPYRTDIDGLRAVAVLSVLFYHIGLPYISGGYVGVDIFFVISGFLITRIVYNEALTGRFSFIRFYERRARRLLPALFAVVAAGFVAGWFVSSPYDFDDFGLASAAALFFVANFHFKDAINYFQPDAEYLALLHTWSLAVEEQFYLFFPAMLFLAIRYGRVAIAVGALGVGSLVAGIVSTEIDQKLAFYMLPFRAWELMAGAAIALWPSTMTVSRAARETIAAAGIAMIAVAVTLFDDQTVFPGSSAIVPVLGAALIIHAGGSGETLVGRGLSLRPVVFVGLISYSLYLWHWPILAYLRQFQAGTELSPVQAAGVLVASLTVSALSWKFVEQPFRRSHWPRRGQVFGWSAAGALALGLTGLAVHFSGGAFERTSPEYRLLASGATDTEPQRFACDGRLPERLPCRIGPADAPADLLLLGDSHAASILGAISHVQNQRGRAFWLATHISCPPALGIRVSGAPDERTCARHTGAVVRWLERGKSGVTRVVLSARWAFYASGQLSESGSDQTFPLVLDGREGTERNDLATNNRRLLETGLARTLRRLRAAGIDVTLLGSLPEIGWNVPRKLANASWRGIPPPAAPDLEAYERRNAEADSVLRRVAERYTAQFIPLGPLLCRPKCVTTRAGHALYVDDNHLSAFGARKVLGPRLESALGLKPGQ